MKLGVIVPQGWTGEYDGWDPLEAWTAAEVARQADRLGFESIWLFDHFHGPSPDRRDHLRVVHVAGGTVHSPNASASATS